MALSKLRKKIVNVINGKSNSCDLPFKPLYVYETMLINLGYEIVDSTKNGWECYVFLYFGLFDTNKQLFCLEGSLWYGKIKFRKLTEDE